MAILSSVDLAFAAPSISIETSQSVYEYGDHLVMIINVSEITGDDGYIYITDPAGKKSLLIQLPISQKYVELPSKFTFDLDNPSAISAVEYPKPISKTFSGLIICIRLYIKGATFSVPIPGFNNFRYFF